MQLFQRVKLAAKRLAGSETKLAAALGLPQRTLNGYLNEKSQRNLWEHLPKILQLYPSIRRDWLYFGEGEMTEETPPQGTKPPLAPVVPPRTAEVPSTVAMPVRAAAYVEGKATSHDITAETVALREKLLAAYELNVRLSDANVRLNQANTQLTDELIRMNAERRKLEERLAWEKMPDKIALSPLTVRGGTSEEH